MADVEVYRSNSVTLVPNGNGLPDHGALDDLLNGEQIAAQRRTPADNAPAATGRSHRSSPVASTVVAFITPRESPEPRVSDTPAELVRTPSISLIHNDRLRSKRSTAAAGDDREMEELDIHRRAVQELTDKILGLNNKRLDLERENADLRRQLDNYLYAAKPSLELDDGEQLDITELKRRYALVKGKVQRQAADLKEYKDKVLELQKKLLEKNETEKQYLTKADSELRRRVEDQQLIHQLRSRKEQIANFEELYMKQQRVIEKLERLVNTKDTRDNQEERINEILREENKLLRFQLGELTAYNITERRNAAKQRSSDEDLLRLQHKLEVAEQRAKSLEKQLADNARQWSRDKVELQRRVNEAGFGLNWPSPFPFHRSPLPNVGTTADRERDREREREKERERERERDRNRDRDYLPGDYRSSPSPPLRRTTHNNRTKQSNAWN